MKNINTIKVLGVEVKIKGSIQDRYISLTDIARHKNPDEPKDIIKNWMRSKNTIEFLGLWEELHNLNFKGVEFDSFKNEAGSNAFVLSPQKWIKATNAIGLVSKSGRSGGTFAHQDIAFEFASWISPHFKLYLLKEFQRLKENEFKSNKIEWETSRILSKVNYRIHTDAIKMNLIPQNLAKSKHTYVYASEADLLNLALFGITAKTWRDQNHSSEGNIRDNASIEQLIVLTNLESLNAELIKENISPEERLIKLNKIAIEQLNILIKSKSIKELKEKK